MPISFSREIIIQEAKLSLSLAVPLAMIQLSEGAVSFVDTLMMGWLSTEALAAGGLGAIIFWTFLSLCTGIFEMTGALAAEAYGASQYERVSQINCQALWLSFVISLPMMVLLWHLDGFLLFFGQEEIIVEQAMTYLRAIVWGFPAALGLFVFKEVTTALAQPKLITGLMLLGIPLNIVLNMGLMYGKWGLPKLGLAGIGWSSTVVFWGNFGAAAILLMLLPRFRRWWLLRYFRRSIRLMPHRQPITREILRLGWPLCVDYGTEFGALTTAALLMGVWSTHLLAAHRIVMTTTELLLMLSWGIAYAAAMRTGHEIGANDPERAQLSGGVNMAMNLGLVLVLSIPLWLFPGQIAGFYLDVTDPENAITVQVATNLFKIGIVFQLFQGVRLISAGSLQGLQDTSFLAAVDFVAHWGIGIGLGYFTGQWLGWEDLGLWWSLVLGQAVAGALLTIRFHRLIAQRIRL